ncbi:hypothetical protein AAJP47_10045 [Psychrobacter sp. B38]|uniref:hypothetical protein n=1 Tax=Psychrobacter sp. B38 TaxID=3143538 RepID=UPI003210928D
MSSTYHGLSKARTGTTVAPSYTSQVAIKHESSLAHGTIKPTNQPVSDYLDNPVVTDIIIGGAVVATVAVGIFLAPEIAAGALILRIATL